MGLFGDFLGYATGAGTGSSSYYYSSALHTFTQYQLHEFFEHLHITTLTIDEKHLVESAVEKEASRRGGKMSLRHINEILRKLKYQQGNHISENDRLAIMKAFQQYVATHGHG